MHRLQARTKLVLVLWLVVILMIANQRQWHFAPYIVTGIFAVGGLMLSGLSLRELWRRTRFLIIVMFASSLFSFFGSTQKSPILMVLGPVRITEHSVWILMISFTVFVVLYFSSLILTMTTMPVALVEAITMLLSPLRRWKWPVDDFALMLLLAFRFIPTFLSEAEQLVKAQMARGADTKHGTWRERIQSVSMFFYPLFHSSLRHASELATALNARGYQSDGKRTPLHEARLRGIDYGVICLVIVVTAGSLLL
ncbi:energy-coupling factor transporter transmembrane protein EcfT [Dictyobacter sp. S3.2.2.5]|uniref:Energy-coupling factor transporter transmembrane protein EcfT n=1 Tax=Dictyobacter halimunensis TaxID=3026934 RepID=A0ABQ6FN74_9CHLR|nr:energy-coupling factor transporter transmembrane protein EcfT [Dictyobacter sp. S3.2.2.5]